MAENPCARSRCDDGLSCKAVLQQPRTAGPLPSGSGVGGRRYCAFPRARMVQEYAAIVVKFFTSDGKFSSVKVGAQLLVLVALVVGLVAFVGNNKTVTLNVDGKVSSVQTFGGTVGQVVKGAKVELKPADRVSPSVDSRVEDGIRHQRQPRQGRQGRAWTAPSRPSTPPRLTLQDWSPNSAWPAPPRSPCRRSAQLAVTGSFVSISTPKTVSVVADGKATTTTTTAATVARCSGRLGLIAGRQRPHLPARQRARRQRHGDQGLPRGHQPDRRNHRAKSPSTASPPKAPNCSRARRQ